MYAPHAEEWLHVIRDIDSSAKFSSFMSDRLRWKSRT